MKRILYGLLFLSIGVTSCTKRESINPSSSVNTPSVTAADFNDAKAYVRTGYLKTSEPGVVLDYDFMIKEVSADNFVAAIRLNGVRANGTRLNGVKFNGSNSAYRDITVGINIANEGATSKVETSFAILLGGAKAEKNGDMIVFDPFTYKGDIVNDVIDVTVKLTIGGGSVVIKDNSTVVLDGSTISLKENSNIIVNGGNIVFTDESSFFVTRSGMTVEQNPNISKSWIRGNTKPGETVGEALDKVVVIVSGDPADAVSGITYVPAPIALDPNKPDVLTKLPVMEFKETHYNKHLGMHRYISTLTWSEVYAKYGLKPILGSESMRIHKLR